MTTNAAPLAIATSRSNDPLLLGCMLVAMRVNTRRLPVIAVALVTAVVAFGASPRRSVRDFGAVGDGSADDTTAIQKAVDAGGGVWLPAGNYRITKTIVADLTAHGPISISGDGTATLTMAGAGPAIELRGSHAGTAAPKTVKPRVWTHERTPTLDGFEIVGAHPEADGVLAAGTMQATFTRLVIRQTRNAIHLTGRNRNVVISGCHLYENRGAGVLMEKLNLHQVNITNSHISYNGGGGIVVRESEVRNLQVGTCDIEANMAADGPPAANVLLDVRKGSIREGAIVGCTLQHSHLAKGSANIRMLGSAAAPRKVGYFAISANALSDVAVNIHLKNARGVTITGNSVWKGFEHDLLVEGSSNIVVGPNLFDRNPDYRPADSPNGLLFRDSTDLTLTGLHINGATAPGAALVLRRCRRVNLNGATILKSAHAGLLLDDVENVLVSGCLILDERPAAARQGEPIVSLRLTSGRDNQIVNNHLNGLLEVAQGTARVAGNQ